ncbi:MAG: hypothetical protein JOZ58_16365, partial [Acetobacteraceae bacterium]|nr:hypothetical protein [Acetobacteraceae bacterium]
MRARLGLFWAWSVLLGAVFLGFLGIPQPRAEESNDLREFRLGMKVEELPRAGYLDFSCEAAPSKKLTGWQDYR